MVYQHQIQYDTTKSKNLNDIAQIAMSITWQLDCLTLDNNNITRKVEICFLIKVLVPIDILIYSYYSTNLTL